MGCRTAISWIKAAIPTMSRVVLATGPVVETFPRENRSPEELQWQPRKKQKKRRNINRPARRHLAKPRNSTGLSGEAPLERLFLFLPASPNFAITAPSDVSQ